MFTYHAVLRRGYIFADDLDGAQLGAPATKYVHRRLLDLAPKNATTHEPRVDDQHAIGARPADNHRNHAVVAQLVQQSDCMMMVSRSSMILRTWASS